MSSDISCPFVYRVFNDLVPRSKRPLDYTEDGDPLDSKRQCTSSRHDSFPSNGLAPSPVHGPPGGAYDENSDVDDSILDASVGESIDSLTDLSQEAEDELLASEDEEKGPYTVPLHPASKKTSECSESWNHLNQGSQNQAGLDLGSKGPLPPEDASVNLEKGNDVPSAIEKVPAESRRETSAGGDRPSVGQASIDQKEPRGENAGNIGVKLTVGSQFKVSPSCSSSVREQRENHGQDPQIREPNRPRRICIQETDLEASKEKYINAVLNHACRREPVIGAVNEMLALMQKVASEYKGYSSQHTTDLTVRNYAQRSKDPPRTFSLSQWVDQNGRSIPRFASLPEVFQRSPIPS
ncbi:S100P-binding protein [Anolis carolinensis]|uniref:S100P-binding protein n=1 Tax=Anolis carolinensis TaxID=28377 RepID=UPI000203AE8A|nr:PREDICTED: S100P-binding protein [Anolis carolinensis]|eukprot:XP_003228787.1 PREDICTED: S100P-binding protein [Anolis carolinensis]